jgi:long-subunit fatty acid transport protein
MPPRGAGTALALFVLVVVAARTANATNIYEFPDNGSEQMGRGGAWIARASDPLAAFYNPAGLAGQETRSTLQTNLIEQHTCYARLQAPSDTTDEPLASAKTGMFPQVCARAPISPDPQVGLTYRLGDRVGVGVLPFLAPSAASGLTWPMFVNNGHGVPEPAPQRYLILSAKVMLVTPTIGIGVEVAPGVRLGASFQWGIANFDLKSTTAAVNGAPTPATNDILAEVKGREPFIPGFTLGALWSANDRLDVAAWYKWSAPLDAGADLRTETEAFSVAAAEGKTGGTVSADLGDVAKVRLVVPMEAKIGLRYHQPRSGAPGGRSVRDPLAQDRFDVELDFTWANDSAASDVTIRMPSDAQGNGTLQIPGTPGYAPPFADIHHGFRDVVGVRLGGDYDVLPDRLAVRAGTFLETRGQDATYQNIDVVGSQKVGIAFGATYRVHLGRGEKRSALEIMAGFMHVFYASETNFGPSGLSALAGTACNPIEPPSSSPTCRNGVPKFHTSWPVNLGTITSAVNMLNLGLSYRF